MSGLTTFLQTELLSLSSEARRKHPEIKEAAERLSAILRSFKERPGYSISDELSKSDDALRPFTLACETKQVKLVTIAIGCIQKLISYHAIPETSVRTVLRTLTDISIHGVDIQLKILQTVLPLLTNYNNVHDDILAEALLICFRLQDSKIIVVNNTAAATLRQLVIYVFDKVTEEDKQELPSETATHVVKLANETTVSLQPCAKDAYYLFQDLCLLTNNESPEYLRLGRLSETFGLELIESVLTNHYTLFKKHKELSSLLRERVCAMIIKTFSEKHEFPQTMRFTRVVYILIKQFSELLITECEIFLSMFVKILEPENPLWQRVLAMEIFRGVCGNPMLLCSIYDWYDSQANSTNVFRDMITAFGRLATEKPQLLGATQGGRESIDFGQGSATLPHTTNAVNATSSDNTHASLSNTGSTIRIQCIDQLDKADPPAIPETYIFYLALLCLNSIADGLAGYTLPRFSTNNKTSSQQQHGDNNNKDGLVEESETEKKDIKLITEMANVAWPGLLAAMSFYITTDLDEDLFQSTMRSYQNFTNVCGILGLVVPRDAFLTNLCKNAIPPVPALSSGYFSGKNAVSASPHSSSGISYSDLTAQQQHLLSNITLSDKNLYSLRVLLNITMMLGGVLGSSWYLVLETLQQADFLLYNRPSPKGNTNATSAYNASAPGLRRTLTGTSSVSSTGPVSPGQPTLSQMMDADHVSIIYTTLNRLFKNSGYLDGDAFTDFTTALCRLSAHYSGVPFKDGDVDSSNKSSRAKIFNEKSFAMEKLHDIALMNMGRLLDTNNNFKDWDLIMSHLISTANYVNTPNPIRVQSCDTISDIIIAAMNHALTERKDAGDTTQNRLLKALNECINGIDVNDKNSTLFKHFVPVQKMGLETLNNLLQTSGHFFTCGWGLIFDMLCHVAVHYNTYGTSVAINDNNSSNSSDFGDKDISDARDRSSIDTTSSSVHTSMTMGTPSNNKAYSGLIKVAFSSLQLICTDFLSTLSPDCLRQCIATLGAFGTQTEDLNISLTAVGLLWNLSDFIQTKRLALLTKLGTTDATRDDDVVNTDSLEIEKPIDGDESPKVLNILWMLLLLQLAKICIDGRPEVRNGAIQTLFRTIMMNGNVLGPNLWQACIWQVLFPLLDAIKSASIQAAKAALVTSGEDGKSAISPSSNNERESSGFMLHHSRDTADKQWDETKVLVLTGITKSYRDFMLKLCNLPSFERAWALLLTHLENYCLRSSQEVALAAVKSMKSMVTLTEDIDLSDDRIMELWRLCWNSWVRIGTTALQMPLGGETKDGISEDGTQGDDKLAPLSKDLTQDTLTAYVHMFIDLYKVISVNFSLEDVKQLLAILRNVLVYSTSPLYRPDVDHLSPLQESVLHVVNSLDMDVDGMAPLVLMDLCEYMTLAFMNPQEQQHRFNAEGETNESSHGGGKFLQLLSNQSKFSTVTYIALNKKCSSMVANLFKDHVKVLAIYTDGVFERIISSYGVPMKLKYDCPPSYKHGDDKTPLWKTASKGFLDVICIGLEALHGFGEEVPQDRFVGVWRTLVDIFDGNLLSPSTPPASLTIEELDVDEHFDISMLSMIQNDIVIYLGQDRVPLDIIKKFVHVTRESSRLYYVDEHEMPHRDQPRGDYNNNNNNSSRSTTVVSSNENPPNGRTSDLMGTTGTIVPVMKESFAYAAFKLLFRLCSAEKQDFRAERKRIAQAAVPVLLDRCETILRNYTTDEPLLGRCPFPRYLMGVRKEEMLFCLRQSIQLQLQQGIMETGEKGSIKGLLLSSSRAHLFYLYPSFCRMLTCEDHAVVELIRECLRVAGLEMGFDMGPSEI
ncbi:hypothetical protein BC941DRAFT_410389 [Chlamydoabsidia padenii]|nr:hypothetical protein BC941DRAFT_410389 [Chlamydoabsidia padenii]